jgi:hypothetical protein
MSKNYEIVNGGIIKMPAEKREFTNENLTDADAERILKRYPGMSRSIVKKTTSSSSSSSSSGKKKED